MAIETTQWTDILMISSVETYESPAGTYENWSSTYDGTPTNVTTTQWTAVT